MSISDDIARLHQLHQAGALNDGEFAQLKARLLDGQGNAHPNGQSHGQGNGDWAVNHLRRSRRDRWLGGVCGGLARISGAESWIWRALFVLFVLYGGAGVFLYVLAWIFIPEEA
jgi:phage shock protein PspC (stress-responsive transcriptional regulator)